MKGRYQLMEYKIISGRTVELRRVRMQVNDNDPLPKRRGLRVRGKTSLRKILRNENESVKNLARLINCNFGRGDLFVTLTYDNDHLPADRESADDAMNKFLRVLKRKSGVSPFKYIKTTAVKNSETGEKTRLHHHLLLPAGCEELIYALWLCPNDVSIRKLDGSGDYTKVADYIIKNTDTGENGGKPRYSPSRNLDKPVYTEPVPCKLRDRVRIPRDASLKEQTRIENEDTGVQSLYVRYTKAAKPEKGDGKRGRQKKDCATGAAAVPRHEAHGSGAAL